MYDKRVVLANWTIRGWPCSYSCALPLPPWILPPTPRQWRPLRSWTLEKWPGGLGVEKPCQGAIMMREMLKMRFDVWLRLVEIGSDGAIVGSSHPDVQEYPCNLGWWSWMALEFLLACKDRATSSQSWALHCSFVEGLNDEELSDLPGSVANLKTNMWELVDWREMRLGDATTVTAVYYDYCNFFLIWWHVSRWLSSRSKGMRRWS